YRDMLREFGYVGAFLCSFMILSEIANDFSVLAIAGKPTFTGLIGGVVLAAIFGAMTGWAPGRGLFIFLMLVMLPLARTEFGVDSWVTDLMKPAMGQYAGWVVVYTALVMMILRFGAGAIVHRTSPLGLLAISATIAMVGLFALSTAAGAMILV